MVKLSMFIILSMLLFSSGCDQGPADLSFPESNLPVRDFFGFKIPQFQSAKSQLNYARSEFSDPEEKKAALNIIYHLFPDAHEEGGKAGLILAYMNLGHNYRVASPKAYTLAIAHYTKIIERYESYPQILVKANWYLGWIYCDLIQEKERGIQYYWKILRSFPDETIGIYSPVQWANVLESADPKHTGPSQKKSETWASISLLEIIRNSSNQTEVMDAFYILWGNYKTSRSTGLAIQFLLSDPRFAQKAKVYVAPYLALNVANPYLAKDIKTNAKIY